MTSMRELPANAGTAADDRDASWSDCAPRSPRGARAYEKGAKRDIALHQLRA